MKSAGEYNCIRCEAKDKTTKAETFVTVDGLLNDERHPLCLQCKKEWEEEYKFLNIVRGDESL